MKAFCFLPPYSSEMYIGTDNSAISDRYPFFIPDFDTRFTACPALVLRIGRVGKSIAARFASRYFDSMTAGFMITADNRLAEARDNGAPWCGAVVFDGSMPHGPMIPAGLPSALPALAIETSDLRTGDTSGALTLPAMPCIDPAEALAVVSAANTVKTGDLLYIGYHSDSTVLRRDTAVTLSDRSVSGTTPLCRLKVK